MKREDDRMTSRSVRFTMRHASYALMGNRFLRCRDMLAEGHQRNQRGDQPPHAKKLSGTSACRPSAAARQAKVLLAVAVKRHPF